MLNNKQRFVLASTFYFFLFSSVFGFNNVTINCDTTIGTCIGGYFDALINYLDTLGFLDASWALILFVFHGSITLLSYPSVQFVAFWVIVAYVASIFLKPLICCFRCVAYPIKRTLQTTKVACTPCLRTLSPSEQREIRSFLAQGDETSVQTPQPGKVESISSSVVAGSSAKVPVEVGCEKDVTHAVHTTKDPCSTDLLKEADDGEACGTIDYSLSKNIGKSRVAFKELQLKTSMALRDTSYTRMTRINTPVTMSTGQTGGTILMSQPITTILQNNALFKQLRARYTLFRFDMRFILVPQYSAHALGSVMMYYRHDYPTSNFTNASSDFINFGFFPHVWLQCSSDEAAVLEIKHPSAQHYFDFRSIGTNATNFADKTLTGRLVICVGHPLFQPTGANPSLNFELHMQMVNIKVAYGQAPLYATQGLVDITTNNFSDINNSVLPVNMTGDSLSATVPFGFDKPSDTRQPPGMLRKVFPKLFPTRGPIDATRLTYNQCDATYDKIEGEDEMSVPYLMSCETLISGFNLTASTTRGSLVDVLSLTPTPTTDNNTAHTIIQACATGCVYDTVTFTFRIPKAAYQTGKLFACLTQGLTDGNGKITAVPGNLTVSYDMLALPGTIIDLSSCDFEHKITIPWTCLNEFVTSWNFAGNPTAGNSMYTSDVAVNAQALLGTLPVLAVYCILPPGTSANVANTVTCYVGRSFKGFKGIYGAPPAITTTFTSQGKNTVFSVGTHKPCGKEVDDFINLRQLWLQPHFFASGYIKASGGERLQIGFSNILNNFEMSRCFTYAQGSIRVLCLFTNWACDYIMVEHQNWTSIYNPVTTENIGPASFLNFNNAITDSSLTSFKSVTYNPAWKVNGTTNKPILVEKASPYCILEIPIIRPSGVMNIQADVMSSYIHFAPAGCDPGTVAARVQLFTMAGDDLRLTHIRQLPDGFLKDTVNDTLLVPHEF